MEAKRAKLAEAAKQQDRDRRALDLRARERTRLKAALITQVCYWLTHLPLLPSCSVSVHKKHIKAHQLTTSFKSGKPTFFPFLTPSLTHALAALPRTATHLGVSRC